jgi:endonuclease/exonuclease/phosphatase family metal-dependent hydrolase
VQARRHKTIGAHDPKLTCATWNIHGCIGRDGRYDRERTRSVLRELDADLVGLQEVEVLREAPGLLDFFTADSDWTAIAGPTLLRPDGHYGNAVLCRLPVLRQARVDLSLAGCEPRGAIQLLVRWGDLKVQLLATHLGLRPKERRIQTLRLLRLIQNPAGDPSPDITVLAGDLNEWFLWGRPLRWLRAYFRSSRAVPSFPAGWPLFALDRIWIDPHDCLAEMHTRKCKLARMASDHLPIVATLRPPGGTRPH